MLSKSRSLCIQKEPIDKDICISNSSRGSRQHRKCLKTGLVKHKRAGSSSSADPSSTESIEEISRRTKDSYVDSSFLKKPSMDRLIKKLTISTIPVDQGESKCTLVKEFILYYDNKGFKVFNSSAKGKEEYCGPCQLSRITPFALNTIKNPYFFLLQEMFSIHGISIIDAYLKSTVESTWKSYKSGWNIFIKFLVKEKYIDTYWEDKKDCEKVKEF
jgi:hypothetical protein